jgi:hypothetical protein
VNWLKSEALCQRSYKLNRASLPVNGGTRTVEDFIKQLASQDLE